MIDNGGEYAYLGYKGLLIPIACTGQVGVSQNKQRTEGLSLEGHRRVLVYGNYLARKWSVSGDMPLHVARNLLTIQQDQLQAHREYSFLTPQATLANALTGEWIGSPATDLVMVGEGLTTVASPGTAGRLVTTQTLVQAGGSVTASAYVETRTEGARLVVEFFNESTYLSGNTTNIPFNQSLQRFSVTGKAPVGATKVRVAVTGIDFSAANPAITWGDQLRPYMPPLGSRAVYLDPLSFSMSPDTLFTMISNCQGTSKAVIEGVSFDVLEVS